MNTPTRKEIEDAYLFSGTGSNKFSKKRDVTLILGVDHGSSHASILLCRFHKFNTTLDPLQSRFLFEELWGSLKVRKYECRRSGGSSGLISDSAQNRILPHIRDPGTCPRNGYGTVWIPGRSTWYVYYMSTKNGEVKTCQYTNPVPGGSFRLNSSHIKKHPFLIDFISTKPLTASIAEAITGRVQNLDGIDLLICPQAVRTELMNIGETRSIQAAMYNNDLSALPSGLSQFPKQFSRNVSSLHHFYGVYLHYFIKCTLVMHAVGWHLDVFADGDPSIENKKCFEILSSAIPIRDILESYPNGRGGGTTANHFIFALLDWNSGQRSRRRVWTNPANAHLPHGINSYPARQAMSETIWNNFFNVDTVRIPQGISLENLGYEDNDE